MQNFKSGTYINQGYYSSFVRIMETADELTFSLSFAKMKKVFLDTNILLDFVTGREGVEDASCIL